MTLIKSAYFKGVRIGRSNTFNPALPGLMMWCEADYDVTLSGNNIESVRDRSGFDNTIQYVSESNRPQLVTSSAGFKVVQNNGVRYGNIINPEEKNWNAILRQQPFGIFTMLSKSNFGGGTRILQNVVSGPNEMRFWVTNAGSVDYTFRNSNGIQLSVSSGTGLVPGNMITFATVDLICYGPGNNPRLELFVNNSSVATLATSNVTGLETVGTDFRVYGTYGGNSFNQFPIILVYDWTGYSVAEINNFRQRINNLREEKYGVTF
jgi:hypothetical protein